MNLYQEVLQAMDASNASGLVTTWATKWRDQVWEEVRANGGGTDAFNTHPVNIVCADKMLQLAGIYITDDQVSLAYSKIIDRAAPVLA